MSAQEYYNGQGYGAAHVPDYVPLLPVQQAALSNEPVYSSPQPYSYAPITASPSLPAKPPVNDSVVNAKRTKWTKRLKRYQRYFLALRSSAEALSTLLSIIMFGIMAFVIVKFYSTKDAVFGGQAAWPPSPKLWPTFLLLLGSVITLLLGIITLIGYCRRPQKARGSWRLVLIRYGFHIGIWLTITFLYRYEKGLHNVNDDLWAWSCGKTAKKLQEELHSTIDFDILCEIQVRLPLPVPNTLC
jgi:hypothetical protein